MIRAIGFLLAALAASAATPGARADSADLTAHPADQAPFPAGALRARLQAAAPDADPNVLALALEASACAIRSGDVPATSRLAVIDYSRPSTERRLWVFDLQRARLLHAEHVAHGRGSGENLAHAFSNRDGSHQSSLGLFVTADTYVGGNGYSLNLDGLEPDINDKARARRIVMHGAPYVDPAQAMRQGRLGRSYGCPALRPAVASQVIDTLKQGQLLFAYYPDQGWLRNSRFLHCEPRRMAGSPAAERSASAP
jgi:hypothetical protein